MLYFKPAKWQCLVCISFQKAKQLSFLLSVQTSCHVSIMAQDGIECWLPMSVMEWRLQLWLQANSWWNNLQPLHWYRNPCVCAYLHMPRCAYGHIKVYVCMRMSLCRCMCVGTVSFGHWKAIGRSPAWHPNNQASLLHGPFPKHGKFVTQILSWSLRALALGLHPTFTLSRAQWGSKEKY